jgi:hypothetical protein
MECSVTEVIDNININDIINRNSSHIKNLKYENNYF